MKTNQGFKVQCLFASIIAILLLVPLTTAKEPDQQVKTANFDESGKFFLYQEGTDPLPFIPHGVMPELAALGKMIDFDLESTRVPPNTGEFCWEVNILHWNNSNWVGIMSSTEDGWWGGDSSGLVYDMSDSDLIELEWSMRGLVGGEVVRVELGSLWREKCGDVIKKDGVEIGKPIRGKWETLEPTWKRYTLSLQGFELSRLANGFTFVLEERRQSNATPLTFFIDDIALVRTGATEPPIDGNTPPVWTTNQPPEQIEVTAGQEMEIPIEATDANGDRLTYSKISGPDWASVDSAAQVLFLSPPPDTGPQSFSVELEVTDGQASVPKSVTVTVKAIEGNTVITFSPVEVTVSPGEEFTIEVQIDNVTNLAGFQIDLLFNPDVLEGIEVAEGNFLKGGGDTFWTKEGIDIDNAQGQIFGLASALFGGGVSGSGTLLTVTFKAKIEGESVLQLQNIKLGDSSGKSIPHQAIVGKVTVDEVFPACDVNQDGTVNIFDLTIVARNFGKGTKNGKMLPDNPRTDVNPDGCVDIFDLIIVAQCFGEPTNSAAPAAAAMLNQRHAGLIAAWLAEARAVDDGSEAFRRGIAVLQRLLSAIVPEKTLLLPNYPNPFNPETWIPYQLSEPSQVEVTIYNAHGQMIRRFDIGFQTAGVYRTKDRAVYWDGRNDFGERVASGVYFYAIKAGDFSAMRKMTVLK